MPSAWCVLWQRHSALVAIQNFLSNFKSSSWSTLPLWWRKQQYFPTGNNFSIIRLLIRKNHLHQWCLWLISAVFRKILVVYLSWCPCKPDATPASWSRRLWRSPAVSTIYPIWIYKINRSIHQLWNAHLWPTSRTNVDAILPDVYMS